NIIKSERSFVYEKLCELISKKSFKESKTFWRDIKSVFQTNMVYQPFIYFHNNKFVLSKGMNHEDLKFQIVGEQLYYEGNIIVVSPLELQRLFDTYNHSKGDDKKEKEEYASYCISRELEKHQVQLLQKKLFRRNVKSV